MKQIGLYFGTFNPIHLGHVMVASEVLRQTDLDEIWFVLTPHNPHKKKASLLDDHHRLELCYRALEKYEGFRVSDIEFGLPQPNYTAHTLAHLREKHPKHEFSLIMGQDNLNGFHKWKNFDAIIKHHRLLVHPRPGNDSENNPEIPHTMVWAPQIEISSSHIRKLIQAGNDPRPYLDPAVYDYIDDMMFYQ